MKVGFATVDWSKGVRDEALGKPAMGGSNWIRFGQYLPYMKEITPVHGAPVWNSEQQIFGVDTECGWDVDAGDERYDFDLPVIFIQRIMDKGIGQQIAIARANGQIIIQDIDDDFWSIPKWNTAYWHTHPSKNSEANTDFYAEALANSNLIITSTPHLTNKMKKLNDFVVQIENHVDVDRFAQARKDMPNWEETKIGWTGSVGMKTVDLNCTKPWAGMFNWHHIGHVDIVPLAGVLGERVSISTSPLCASSEYAHHFLFDVGVVPLQHDAEFNAAKSFIKGLEYSAAGLPFVASPAPEYVRFSKEQGVGFIAWENKPKQWIKHLKALVNDRDYREFQGLVAQDKVRQSYDVRIGAAKLEGLALQALKHSELVI
jgi:hypothetical protein